MSRIAKKTIPIPDGVTINTKPGMVEVSGPKGKMSQKFPENMSIEINEQEKYVLVNRPDDERNNKALHGLAHVLVKNAIVGVSKGFVKNLKIEGVGYNAKLKGRHVELQIGFCLPKTLLIPEGIDVKIPSPTEIIIEGCDKQIVGQFAADVRAIRPPDSYKGKGIRYKGEVVKLKEGKKFGASA